MKKINICKFFTSITCIILYCFSHSIYADEKNREKPYHIKLNDTETHVYISPHIDIYHDQNKSWDIDDFQYQIESSQPLASNPTKNMGFTLNKLYWGRFSVTNKSHEKFWILQFKEPLIDHLEVYIYKSKKFSTRKKLGRLYKQQNINKQSRFYNIDYEFEHEETIDVYFSISSPDPYAINVHLHDQESFISSERVNSSLLGLYYGIIGSALIFSIFVLSLLRDKTYLYYIIALTCLHLICFTNLNGLVPSAIPIYSLWAQRDILSWCIHLGLAFFILFSRDILCRDEHLQHLKKYFNFLLIWPAINTVIFLIVDYKYTIILSNLMITIVSGIILLLALVTLMKKNIEAIYFLLAWFIGISTGLVFSLKHWGIIPATPITNNIWQTGMAIEGVLFSLVLGRNMLYERRARLAAQKESLQHAYEAQKAREKAMTSEMEKNKVALNIEIGMNKKLESKVKERTQDLNLMLKKLEEHNIQLTELSINDPLTQARNRRFFNDRYLEMWHGAVARNEPLNLIMIDADHFKKVNDVHGHLTGDHCLKILSNILSQYIGGKSFFARYGGEEFIAVIPELSLRKTYCLAEKIRQSIEDTKIVMHDMTIELTASLGLANVTPDNNHIPENLIELCDKALYQAKDNGRNQVFPSFQLSEEKVR